MTKAITQGAALVLCALLAAGCARTPPAQPGDLIQMGEGGSWRHVVIISQLVSGPSGDTIDYLVCSNTSNLSNWPARLYGYPQQMLTCIAWWN